MAVAAHLTSKPHPGKPSAARERLLSTASRLFYANGITATGVDRVISEASVTRATFYRHFPGKEDLVVAYLQAQDDERRGQIEAVASHADGPDDVLAAIIEGLGHEIGAKGFRGCPFINAAAEYPQAGGRVREVIDAHRTWFRSTLVDLLTQSGHPDPVFAASLMVQLRDGMQVGGYLDDRATAEHAFLRAAESVIMH